MRLSSLKVKKISVENFKSISSAEIYFEKQVKIITGKNGAGKTHILLFLDHLFNHEIEEMRNNIDDGKNLEIEIYISVAKNDTKRIFAKLIHIIRKQKEKIGEEITSISISMGKSTICRMNGIQVKNEAVFLLIKYIREQFCVIYTDVFNHLDTNVSPMFLELISSKIEMDDSILEMNKFFESTKFRFAGQVQPTIEMHSIINRNVIALKEENTGAIREANLKLIDYIVSNDSEKTTILLYDEFELHFHPQLIKKHFDEFIRKFDYSFITTHSRELVEFTCAMPTVELLYLKNRNVLKIKEIERFINLIDISKISGSIFFSDVMIFVEGSFDEYFLKKLLKKRGLLPHQIDIFQLNGAKNFKNIHLFLKKNNIENYIIVLDRDVINRKIIFKKATKNDKLIKSLVDKFEINEEEVIELFNIHAFKKTYEEKDSNGFPKYNIKKEFIIDRADINKFLVLDYDLEHEIISTRSGKFATKKVLGLQSISEIKIGDKKIKSNIKKIIDELIDNGNFDIDNPESLSKKYRTLIKKVDSKIRKV